MTKLTFKVDVEDFWIEEGELASELVKHIKWEVTQEISAKIKDKVNSQLTDAIQIVIQERLAVIIDATLEDLVTVGKITRGGKETTIKEHIESMFVNSSNWNTLQKHMETIAKKFVDELKTQYNHAFANMIVKNIKEQGLLKDEVVQLLLKDES